MNRAYRQVWSAARGAYIIAPETARGNGKASAALRTPALLALAAGLAIAGPAGAAGPMPATTVVPAGGKANAYISANGVPVVNINSANAAGVSHNQFKQYNVEAKGLVLNNSSFRDAPMVQSKLAGQLVGNLNLGAAAKVIVNEVVSANRSVLAGYTEVAGTRADVIVANPYGITCSGCGFINSDRVTLTTGIPGWGADGSLNGVNVSRGDILIDGAGLDASAQQILDLVTRAVRIDGQINTAADGTLGVYAGPTQWSYGAREVTGKSDGADSQPAYAIDSTALGGMYAGRIRLIATEAGVGVRMLGDAAASVDDFRLDAAGKVLVHSRVAAARDMKLAQAGAGRLELAGAGASLTARNDLALQADGALVLGEGLLKAGANLAVRAASLSDTSTASASRSAGANVDLAFTGAAALDGSSWGAGSHLKLDAATLAVGSAGATLYSGATAASTDRTMSLSTSGDLVLAKAKITSTGTLSASARGGAMRLGADVEMTAAGDMALRALSAYDNAGTLIAGAKLTLQGSDSAAVLQAINSGLMQAQTELAIGAGQAAALDNGAGARLLAERIAIDATTLDNGGTIQATSALGVNASTLFTNRAAGMLLTTGAGAAIDLKAASLDNAGRLQSAGAINAAVSGATSNSGKLLTTAGADGGSDGALTFSTGSLANSGMITAAGAASIASAAALENKSWIQAGTLTLSAAALRNQGADSALLARTALTVKSASFDNGGAAQAGTSLSVTTTGALNNSGALQNLDAAGALTLRGAAIANSGTVQAAGGATVTSGAAIDNSGKVLAGATLDLVAAGALSNLGAASVLLAQASMTAHADSFVNDGALQTGTDLAVSTEGKLDNRGVMATRGGDASLTLAGAAISNGGSVQGAGGTTLGSRGAIDNSGDITAGANLSLSAGEDINNDGAGVLLAKGGLGTRSVNFDNRGMVQADAGLRVSASGEIANSGVIAKLNGGGGLALAGAQIFNRGTVQALSDANLKASGGAISNSGKVVAQGELDLGAAGALTNSGGAVLLAHAALYARSDTFDNHGSVQAGTRLDIGARGQLANSGEIQNQNASAAVSLLGASIANSGTVQALGAASLHSASGITNSGQVLADGKLNIHAASALNNTGVSSKIVGQQALQISGNSGFSVSNAGLVQAADALTVGSASVPVALLQNSAGATLLGGAVRIDSVDLLNQGRLQALRAGTLTSGALTNQGSGAVILLGLDSSDSSIQVANSLVNEGAIHGGGKLAINAARIDNTNTAGVSSLSDLTLGTSESGIGNAGALYAGNALSLSAAGQSIINTSSGTLDATDIAVTAATFDNYNTVIATRDTTITTTSAFNNLPTGGVPNVVTASVAYGGVTAPYDSGDYNCNIFGDYCDHLWVYAQNYTVTQGLDGAVPVQKGQVIAGGTINLDYGLSGVNRASLISAPNINISGSGSFTNVDLHLDRIDYARRWRVYKTDSTFGSLNYDYRYPTTAGQFGCNDGGCFGGSAGSAGSAADSSYALETGRTTIQIFSAGVYATNLVFNGGSLLNLGSPYTRSTSATSVAPVASASATRAPGISGGSPSIASIKQAAGVAATVLPGASRTVSVAAANGVAFTGLNLALPANPNGYFVTSRNPTAGYLVETNPLFGAGSNAVGSNYLANLLGIDPDKQQKRLGDANYEAKLIRDQLVAQTGNNIIKGQKNEAAQIKSLMENAASMAGTMGLTLGQPLTAEQAAALTEDMVWMVEQVVGGQKVLVPVVYLAQSTKDAIENGAVMAAANASIKAGTVDNKGGTIAGDALAITTEGDLRNTGGKIKGGDVSVKAGGSIINETLAVTSGGKDFARTVIGAAGSIESTGSLALDAARDISVKGASIKAGGDASLAAGGSITFDTIQNKSADATYKASQGLWGISSSSSSTHTSSTTNIGSGLEAGANLKVKSGADTTIAGSAVKVGGNLDLDAGGNVNLISRQDTVETSVSSSRSGLGVGGGVYGTSTTTTDAFKGRNVASGIEVGGDAGINTANTLTLEGSRLKVGGDAAIKAGDVQVLAGQDVDRSSTTTTTTSFLKLSSSGDSHAGAGAGAGAKAGSGKANGNAKGSAAASAGASAAAGASGSVNLTLAETETTTTTSYKSRAVGSEIEVGNNLSVDARKSIVLQGATVNTGGDAVLKASDVKVLASQDIDITTSKTTTASVGLYIDSGNSAQANASASAGAKGSANGYGAGGAASAQAQAGASADSDTTIDLVRVTTTESNSLDIRNNGGAINAGGKLKVDAADKLTVQGSDIGGDKGVSLKARDMEFLAAEDVSVTSTSTTRTSAGLYISGGASAQANASAGANAQNNVLGGAAGTGAAEGGASADAKAGAGWQARTNSEKTTEGATTARVSTIRSGAGDIERTAQNSITDVGTAIEAAGEVRQSATTIDSRAAKNTSFSSRQAESNSLRVGTYAQANAQGGAEGAGANASAGVEAQFAHEQSASRSDSSEAVVSTIKAGGKVSSTSSGKTTFEGTRISGDGGVELAAKEIDFKAARNTQTSSASSLSVNAAANVGINLGSSGVVDGGVSGGFGADKAGSAASTAVAGGIQSGGKLTIKTQGDARFEGTGIAAAGDAAISAGGKLAFDAARNERSSSSDSSNAEISLSVSKSKGAGGSESEAGLAASGGFSKERASSSEAVTGRVASGGNLTLAAGQDMRFEGTQVAGGGDTRIAAGGNVDFAAARNTSSSESTSFSASLSASKSSSSDSGTGESSQGKSGGIGAEFSYQKKRSSEAVAGAIASGGKLQIKSGGNTALEGTDVSASGTAAIQAGGNVNFKAAESTSESAGVSASAGAQGSTSRSSGPGKAAGAAPGATSTVNGKEHGGSFGLEAGAATRSDKKGGSIRAGAIDVKAGGNAALEGTQLKSDGGIALAAIEKAKPAVAKAKPAVKKAAATKPKPVAAAPAAGARPKS